VPLGIVGDRLALDVLHREVGAPVLRDAAVEQPGDPRMLEPCQDLALAAETLDDRFGVHPLLDQLERRALLEAALDALRQVDRAHPPLAEQADDAPGTDGALRLEWRRRGEQARRARRVEPVEGLAAVGVVRGEQGNQLGAHYRVGRLAP